ncbi:hypothetical protein CDAR_496771 [Caerostris darwini]|uniref:Uncharacterized protein n=1 Tax=Caerostris darwini TaxID=1538125 RepID=A0AAV4U564_9ARAC|nr:hypothetical protein CDAR_496771 [Caerostris darwini]
MGVSKERCRHPSSRACAVGAGLSARRQLPRETAFVVSRANAGPPGVFFCPAIISLCSMLMRPLRTACLTREPSGQFASPPALWLCAITFEFARIPRNSPNAGSPTSPTPYPLPGDEKNISQFVQSNDSQFTIAIIGY